MARLRAWLWQLVLPTYDVDLAQYQMRALSKLLPVMYAIVLINMIALAITHMNAAPLLLTCIVPAVLSTICLSRMIFWLRFVESSISPEDAVRRLREVGPLTALIGTGFTGWALSLFPYGDAYAQVHTEFYMSVTVISCVFCLMHLRNAALLLATVVAVPFTIFFCLTGQHVLIAIAMNFLLVLSGMVVVLLRNYDDFTTMVATQRQLLQRHVQMQNLSDENYRLANVDGLSGLPNRRRFLAELDLVLANAQHQGAQFAVALIDLDGFKGVNDVFGHAAGDRLLAEVGARLLTITGPSVFTARLGGDEFGLILGPGTPPGDVAAFGHRLCALLQGPYLQPDIMAQVSGSVGLVTYPSGALTAQHLFERADYALYHAKEHKTGEAVMFTADHETMIRNARRIEHALQVADLSEEIRASFQPIVDCRTGRTIAFEALARWTNAELGTVGPDIFIPTAERTHQVGRITQIMLTKALAAAATWPESVAVCVNLSAQDLVSSQTMAAVFRIATESRVPPGRIFLEITETAVMRDFEQAAEVLRSLTRFGFKISLDDFGTGYSSLSHVHRLALDKIKIDRSFVSDIHTNQASCDIVNTIIVLSQNLNLECVVEGVETESQRRRLMSMGCRLMQGYLFSKPLTSDGVAHYLAREQAEAAPA